MTNLTKQLFDSINSKVDLEQMVIGQKENISLEFKQASDEKIDFETFFEENILGVLISFLNNQNFGCGLLIIGIKEEKSIAKYCIPCSKKIIPYLSKQKISTNILSVPSHFSMYELSDIKSFDDIHLVYIEKKGNNKCVFSSLNTGTVYIRDNIPSIKKLSFISAIEYYKNVSCSIPSAKIVMEPNFKVKLLITNLGNQPSKGADTYVLFYSESNGWDISSKNGRDVTKFNKQDNLIRAFHFVGGKYIYPGGHGIVFDDFDIKPINLNDKYKLNLKIIIEIYDEQGKSETVYKLNNNEFVRDDELSKHQFYEFNMSQ